LGGQEKRHWHSEQLFLFQMGKAGGMEPAPPAKIIRSSKFSGTISIRIISSFAGKRLVASGQSLLAPAMA